MTTEMNTPEQENKEPVPGSPEYNEMMAAKFREAKEGSNGQYPETTEETQKEEAQDKPQVPEGIPAKFIKEDGTVDVEALAKSYTELEKRGSQKPQESQNDTPKGEDTEEDPKAAEVVSEAGLDMGVLKEKVVSGEGLEDSDYAALEKAGVPREMVDEYIALRQDYAERTKADAMSYIGGEKAAEDLMGWAAQNLSEEEIDGYNEMLRGPRWKVAVDTLKNLRGASKASANEPNLKSASGSPSGTPTGYLTRDDMKADMANPLYHQLGAEGDKFRAEVQRKMAYAAWRRS